jgi:hypothetical protein
VYLLPNLDAVSVFIEDETYLKAGDERDILKKAAVDSIYQCNTYAKMCCCEGLLMKRTFTAKEKTSVFELWKNGKGFRK